MVAASPPQAVKPRINVISADGTNIVRYILLVNPFPKAGTPMNESLVNLDSPLITIRVREGLRNQEVASTLMARKALAERGKILASRRKRQASVLDLFANLLGER